MMEAELAASVAYRITEEDIDGKQQQLLPMLARHREELATDKKLMRFAPDFDRHIQMQRAGILLVLFAYQETDLVGYSSTIVLPHLHYPDLIHAHNDLLFVVPEHRSGGLGLRLIYQTKRYARGRGARFMTWHAKPKTALAELLPKLGCRVQDIVFGEEI